MSRMSGYALPRSGEVFFDARGEDRALRLSWHPEARLMVLSLWSGDTCTATFRMPAAELARFVEALAQGLPQELPARGGRHAAALPHSGDDGPHTEPDLVPEQRRGTEEIPLTGQYRPPR